jgi:hypothetical protein
MSLGETVKGWFRRPAAYLSGEWDRMAPRERRLVGGLVAAVVIFAVLVTGFLTVQSLRDIAESNDETREALAAIAQHRDEYMEAKDRMVSQETRIGTDTPQLAADLEAAAREVGIAIPETTDEPVQAAGRRYNEYKVDVKLRQVDLQALTNFLNKIETGHRLIVTTSLNIRRSFSDQAKMDVDLTAAAYERVKDTGKKRPAPGKGQNP